MSVGSNKFGKLFQWTSFGESHGPAMGVVIDGCPAGVEFNESLLLERLAARRPGQVGATDRTEADKPNILSGIFEGLTLGTPIAVVVENTNQRSVDYQQIKNNFRTGHADDVWQDKFGHRDHRGGGRASARETLNWVIAGSFAEMFMASSSASTKVSSKLLRVGDLDLENSPAETLLAYLEELKSQGESVGAWVEVMIENPPANIGEPIFQKLKAELAHGFMSINACNGVELGDGFAMALKKGSEVHSEDASEVYGGIRGGISTGETIKFRLAFKPTSSIADVAKQGRHDPCVALRALPIVKAMSWSILADYSLASRLNKL